MGKERAAQASKTTKFHFKAALNLEFLKPACGEHRSADSFFSSRVFGYGLVKRLSTSMFCAAHAFSLPYFELPFLDFFISLLAKRP